VELTSRKPPDLAILSIHFTDIAADPLCKKVAVAADRLAQSISQIVFDKPPTEDKKYRNY